MKNANFRRLKTLDYAGAEALNTICANLSFAGNHLKRIVITSCSANDGKSFLTLQIARNLARRGKRVMVVDADLRRSRLVQRCGVAIDGEGLGLAHYLAGYNTLDEVSYETNLHGVCLIPNGQYVANPIPLFNTAEFAEMMQKLTCRFDLVLVDTPPVGVVIDAAEIAQLCDGCILVLEYEKTRRHEALMAKRQIEQTGCQILGCILNKVSFDSISSQKYYSQTYYSHDDTLDSRAVKKYRQKK